MPESDVPPKPILLFKAVRELDLSVDEVVQALKDCGFELDNKLAAGDVNAKISPEMYAALEKWVQGVGRRTRKRSRKRSDDPGIDFDYESLDYDLAERRADALRHVAQLSRSEVLACDLACVTAIAWEYAIDPPIVRTDRMVADDRIRELTDALSDEPTGHTGHEFLVPIERDPRWLEGVARQNIPPDGDPIGFLERNRPMISIRLIHSPGEPDDSLSRRLEHRLGILEQYARSVTERIQQFNADLAQAISERIVVRKAALMRATAAQRATGVPSIHNPAREEDAAKIQRILTSLGGHLTGATTTSSAPLEGTNRPTDPRIFIVHGHDDHLLLELKNYLQNTLHLGQPVVLRETPGLGKTIIEKFEREAESIDVAFVLLTPDDLMVDQKANDVERRRARQNVIFEMGFFLGKLGRSSGTVLLLHKGPVELPSDIAGIQYIDVSNGVHTAGESIRRELRALGMHISH